MEKQNLFLCKKDDKKDIVLKARNYLVWKKQLGVNKIIKIIYNMWKNIKYSH